MHKARAFFYVCAGLFLLALSYHVGARSATAQAPGNPVVAAIYYGNQRTIVLTATGDAYDDGGSIGSVWTFAGNVFGGPTPAVRESFGAMKSRYRGERGAGQQSPDR